MSKIVEKKNESKSQPPIQVFGKSKSCVKDRWEKEWKQITTDFLIVLCFLLLCQRSLRKRMKANHNSLRAISMKNLSCVKDRWEKEWKQITTWPSSYLHNTKLCQRSLRKRMKANHNGLVLTTWPTEVVSKIVEKKNESKSQPNRSRYN